MAGRSRDLVAWSAAAVAFVALVGFYTASACNEAVCASIVSKCMLTQSCKCELRNCTCCKECFNCLDYLYAECCSCVEMCPKPNNTASELSRKSHVEDLTEPTPDLFAALTEDRDVLQRWLTFTFPVDLDVAIYKPKLDKEIKYLTINSEQEVIPLKDLITVNCTVAYMSQCMSWNKCKASCISMGASSYRWFHDGCCECVGHTCINYGINESRCLECPGPDDAAAAAEGAADADAAAVVEDYDQEHDPSKSYSKTDAAKTDAPVDKP